MQFLCASVCGNCFYSLVERKETWRRETEERFANIPDPDMPPGHRMMPEADRVATLTEIRQSKWGSGLLEEEEEDCI